MIYHWVYQGKHFTNWLDYDRVIFYTFYTFTHPAINLSNFFTIIHSLSFAKLLVEEASALNGKSRHQQAKWVGILVNLRQGQLQTALPSIHLANVCSLSNDMNELLNRKTQTFADLLPWTSLKPGLVSTNHVACYICQVSNFSVWITSWSSGGGESACATVDVNMSQC